MRPGLYRGIAPGRRRRRGPRLECGAQRHAQRPQHVGRGATPAAHQPGGVLGPSVEKHEGPRDRAVPAAPRRAARRDRPRFRDHLSHGGLASAAVGADKPRRAAARAYNIVTAEYFRPFADRMTPAAIIPMHMPEEAIEELEFAVKQLGYKVAMLGSLVDRPA